MPKPVLLGHRVAMVADGLAAFALRARQARAAGHTLDLQYYMWHADVTGQMLAREALMAADRGVRVRLLLDDLYAIGRERGLAALDAHPNVELRLFNPSGWRRLGRAGLVLEMLFGAWWLNRRMHNKAWIVDGARVICGGRNIADRYFDAAQDFNFRDLDLAVEGAAAAEAATAFEAYWQSPLARPIAGLARLGAGPRALRRLRRVLEATALSDAAQPCLDRALAPRGHDLRMLRMGDDAIHILSDPPGKASGAEAGTVAPALLAMLERAEREALLISPYFVPGEAGTARLIALVKRGVRVAVVTNSLAATDVVAVHGGYARYRARLLAAGVEIYEMKPVGERRAGVFGSRGASLHTKAMVVDGEALFVGSFNLDPRSVNLNTEMGVMVHSRALARLVGRHHRRLAQGARSWRVSALAGGLSWADGEVVLRREPATAVRRGLAWGFSKLPIEAQL